MQDVANPEGEYMLVRRSATIAALLATIALGATACSSNDNGGGGTTTTAPATSESTSGGGSGGGQESGGSADIVAQNIAYHPTSFTAKSGDTINVENKDGVEHTFTIKGTDVNEKLEPGETDPIKIDLKAGSYGWMCTIHPTMTGTLKVT
jgi:plastocyanin